MKLAVSNIAWASDEEEEVADTLRREQVQHIEIAPTKIFNDPTATTLAKRQRYERFWADRGISIVAFQSLLFGRPDLEIFGDVSVRKETLDVLSRFIELAGQLGVQRLVFGSPKNRIVPDAMSRDEAFSVAVKFFAELGQVAVDHDTCFCIEPNPPAYGCNFVTSANDGLALVTAVGHAGFGLHLDAAGMTLAGDSLSNAIKTAGPDLKHFHASAPYLAQLEEELVDHASAARALRTIRYDGYVSIEMRAGVSGPAAAKVAAAVALVRRSYGL